MYELRRNGAGVQVVYNYEPEVYMQALALAILVDTERDSLKGEQRLPYATALVASGLFSLNSLGGLFGVSKASLTALKVPRPSRLPVRRMGGSLNLGSVPALTAWWRARVEDPSSAHGKLIEAAAQAGTDWPVIARFTARTVQAAKKAALNPREDKRVIIVTEYHGPAAGESKPDLAGHPAGGGESGPVLDFPGFPDDEPEFTLKSAVVHRGDAFTSAADLLAVNEADDGDAGHGDELEDGLPAGSEGGLGEFQGSSGRGVHPFLQP
jgi:hypothetical protein